MGVKLANDAMDAHLENAVGDDIQNKAGWLIYPLKRLLSKSSQLRVVMNDFVSLPNYSSSGTSLHASSITYVGVLISTHFVRIFSPVVVTIQKCAYGAWSAKKLFQLLA